MKEIQFEADPVQFVQKLFGFTPTEYQARFLRDTADRIVARWCRCAGKTTCIALRAIWFAILHPKTLTLIITPNPRMSMIMKDRVEDFLTSLTKPVATQLIEKLQRTTVRFKNGSSVVILPNRPKLFTGYKAKQVICEEPAFFGDDDIIFSSELYPMLAVTRGSLVLVGTPWRKGGVFYSLCQNPDFSKHVVTCEDVVKSGLIKQSVIDEFRAQLSHERFQRELMAKFVDNVEKKK